MSIFDLAPLSKWRALYRSAVHAIRDNTAPDSVRSILRYDLLTMQCERKAATYSHRNGETEAPTLMGKYWFLGWRTNMGTSTRVMDTLDLWSDGRIYGDSIDAYAGQWWGPVQAPWKQSQ